MSDELWTDLAPRYSQSTQDTSVRIAHNGTELSYRAYIELGKPQRVRIRVSNAGRVIIINDPTGPIKVGTLSRPRWLSTMLSTWCKAAGFVQRTYVGSINADGHLEFTAERIADHT